tara:strand:+ start:1223 stop:1381 length:159 start_codon:yes stop_codon:yes gene_type:complete
MPSQKEMAEAYIVQVEQKLKELEAQVDALKAHIRECKDELDTKTDKEEDSND